MKCPPPTLVLGAFVLTPAWGDQQRQKAEAWREQACLRTSTFPAGSDFARP